MFATFSFNKFAFIYKNLKYDFSTSFFCFLSNYSKYFMTHEFTFKCDLNMRTNNKNNNKIYNNINKNNTNHDNF